MPKIEVHLKESLERTGKEYKELHEWIDDPSKKPVHHDITKMHQHAKEIEEKWGKDGMQEFICHIQTDIKAQVLRIRDDMMNVLSYFGIKL